MESANREFLRRGRLPSTLLGVTVLRIQQAFAIVGLLALTLLALLATAKLLGNFDGAREAEENALRTVGAALTHEPVPTGSGETNGELPAGVSNPAVTPFIVLACIVAGAFFTVAVPRWVPEVIQAWYRARTCRPRGFCGWLGCIFQWIWALLQSILFVLLILFFGVVVIVNVMAAVALLLA